MTQTTMIHTVANDRPEGLEELIERGNQLHNRAIFDCLVRWVPAAIRSITNGSAKILADGGGTDRCDAVSLTHSPRVPV